MKPTHAKPSLYAYYFEHLKDVAKTYGYNLVLHGSLNRDLDLIAIPWEEEFYPHMPMIEKFAEIIGGQVLFETDEDRNKFRVKHHGRICYVINLNRSIKAKFHGMVSIFEEHDDPQYYIDISVIPIGTPTLQ